ERAAVRARSPVGAKYDTAVNRESAHEILTRKAQEPPLAQVKAPAQARGEAATQPTAAGKPVPEEGGIGGKLNDWLWGTKRRQGMVETMAKQAARTAGSKLGNQILRGVLGGIF